jgi:hypothetical protein
MGLHKHIGTRSLTHGGRRWLGHGSRRRRSAQGGLRTAAVNGAPRKGVPQHFCRKLNNEDGGERSRRWPHRDPLVCGGEGHTEIHRVI